MTSKHLLQLLLILATGLCNSLYSEIADPSIKTPTLIVFSLRDQFDQEYTPASFEREILIFVCGDKNGSKYTGIWSEGIRTSLSDAQNEQIDYIGVACLQSVPFFMKGIVRGMFPEEKELWTLMDWKGLFSKHYSFSSGKCNILVFNADRKLIAQAAVTESDADTLNNLLVSIRDAMGEAPLQSATIPEA